MPVNVPFWEFEDGLWEDLLRAGLRSHYIASRCAAPKMVARRKGLIVNTSSGGTLRYAFNVPFGVQKAGVPPPLAKRIMEIGESSEFAGRAVVGLAADPALMEKSGRLHLVADLAQEYGFTDIDGRMPAAP